MVPEGLQALNHLSRPGIIPGEKKFGIFRMFQPKKSTQLPVVLKKNGTSSEI
jgi:hypothetical protein